MCELWRLRLHEAEMGVTILEKIGASIPGQVDEETGGEDAEEEESELPEPRVPIVRVADAQVPLGRDRQGCVG